LFGESYKKALSQVTGDSVDGGYRLFGRA